MEGFLKNGGQRGPQRRILRENGREVFSKSWTAGWVFTQKSSKEFLKNFIAARARSVEGSELGLAFVNRIVSLHRGELTLRSRQDEQHGTIFSVRLPVVKSPKSIKAK